MQYGFVKSWDSQKGYGFITTDDEEEVFVHISDLDITLKGQLKEGMRVKFDIRSEMKGDKAVHVRKA